jgi:microfibrillar-associated protein 1
LEGWCRRDREEREALKEAEAEKERIRTMTPSERAAWERDNPKILNQAPKKSWKFMQKYWHKGAFFQEVSDNADAAGTRPDEIFTRDYSAATGEDKLNKEMLPKVRPHTPARKTWN